jgi:hypothetical protein
MLQAIGSLVTAGAACGAGIWALYNFGLRRVGRARVRLAATLREAKPSRGGCVFYLSLEATNTGYTGVRKQAAYVRVARLADEALGKGIARVPVAGPTETFAIFEIHTYLEPGESFEEDLAVHSSGGGPLQVDLEFFGDRPSRTWTVTRIVRPTESHTEP